MRICNNHIFYMFQLKYHDSGREKTCAPSVGQWNMINKVNLLLYFHTVYLLTSTKDCFCCY